MPLILFYLAQLADILTSVIGMSHFGTIEGNPLGWTAVLVGKAFLCAMVAGMWWGLPTLRNWWSPAFLVGSGMVLQVAFDNARLWW